MQEADGWRQLGWLQPVRPHDAEPPVAPERQQSPFAACCRSVNWVVRPCAGPHTSGELMFDHVKFGVSDYAASKAFFLKALGPLGVAVVLEGPPTYGVELSPKGKASLCLYQTEEKPAHLGVHDRESPASRSLLSRGSGGGWQRQWCAWSAPALPRELLCSFRHWSGRAQHRSGLPRTRGLNQVRRR